MSRPGGRAAAGAAAARRARNALLDPASAPVVIAVIIALILAILFVVLGGFREASRVPASTAAGTEVATSLFTVTVLDATVTEEVEEQFWDAEPGETLLLVTVRLENLTDRPAAMLGATDRLTSRLIESDSALLTLDGITATETPRAWHADGGVRTPVLQPGVPADIVIGWPIPDDALTDDSVQVNVFDARERAGQVIVSASATTWTRTELLARVSVEVAR